MTMRTTRRLAVPTALAASLLLTVAACSGGGTGSADPTGDKDGATDDYTPGPLEAMWNEAYGEFNMDDSNAQQARVEQLTAECMAEQGWEYTPVDYSSMDDGFGQPIEGDVDGPEWGTEEYAKEMGYGIATYQEQYSEEEVTETAEPLPIDGEEWTDPNSEYVESLSESAQQAYYEALYGPQPTEEEMESGDWEYNPQDAGCQGKASDEVWNTGTNIWEDPKYESLIEEMNTLYTAVENDPKIAEANSTWSTCMADAGYPGLADSSAAQDTIYTEMSSYWESGEEPPADAIAALAEKERAIATADFTCAKKADVDSLRVKLLHEAEQTFVDAHRAELEELMNALKEQQDAAKG